MRWEGTSICILCGQSSLCVSESGDRNDKITSSEKGVMTIWKLLTTFNLSIIWKNASLSVETSPDDTYRGGKTRLGADMLLDNLKEVTVDSIGLIFPHLSSQVIGVGTRK
jgi:hypothetical protein